MSITPKSALPESPLSATRFSVTIDGVEIAAFPELSRITSEVEAVDYLQPSDREVVTKKLPGNALPPTVVLKRGKTASTALWAWHEAAVQGDVAAARRSCSLVMYGADGKPVARYHLENAWPSKLEIGALKVGASEVLTETVTIVCERLARVAV